MTTSVVGVMKMGNIVSRGGLEPTSHVFWASVLAITPTRFPDVTMLSMPTCLCGSLPERSGQTIGLVSMEL